MKRHEKTTGTSRREFLRDAAVIGGGLSVLPFAGDILSPASLFAQTISPHWARQMGLASGTVHSGATSDARTYESVLAKIAEIGYKEIEPYGGYAGLSPKDFRAMLDRVGLSMPSTHAYAYEGPDLESTLAGFQVMGIKYTEIRPAQQGGARAGGGGGGARAGGAAPGAGGGRAGAPPAGGGGARAGGAPGGGAPGAGGGRGPGGGGQTTEAAKQTAARANQNGALARKYGMKLLIHNHTNEFEKLSDNPQMTQYDILLAETNPELVSMQLDVGWASIAGQDVVAMFKKNPGRFETWHVKDAVFLKYMTPAMTPAQRAQMAMFVPVGLGEIDYRTVFAHAETAGLKHFFVEQDNAGSWGDALAACRTSYTNLLRTLSGNAG